MLDDKAWLTINIHIHPKGGTGKGLPQIVAAKLEAKCPNMSLHALAWTSSLNGTKEPKPKPWETAPDHDASSTNLYCWHYEFWYEAFSWHPPNTHSSIRLPDLKGWFITAQNTFPLLQNPVVVCFSPLQPTLGIVTSDLRLVCSCSAIHEAPDAQFLCWCCFQRQFGTL